MENIEAMLCAYIEGDLDEAGRAEIEKHLAGNPQHRKLIADLIAQRHLLRNLPRVAAPGEVDESLRGQMERSILLDSTPGMEVQGKTGGWRWPQIMTIAAILLLTIALGLTVYRTVVPTFKPATYTQIATSKQPNEPVGNELETDIKTAREQKSVQTQPEEIAAAAPRDLDAERVTKPEMTDKINPPAVPAMLPPAISPGAAATTQIDLDNLRQQLQSNGYEIPAQLNDPEAPVVVVIGSDETAKTNRQVVRFLSSQPGISWNVVPAIQTKVNLQTQQIATGQAMSLFSVGDGLKQSSTQPSTQMATTQPTTEQTVVLSVPENRPISEAEPSTQPSPDVYVARGLTPKDTRQIQGILSLGQATPILATSDEPIESPAATQKSLAIKDIASTTTTRSALLPQSAGAGIPSTNPSVLGAAPISSETNRVDVVIVVESNSLLPATLPTTQPIEPTTQPSEPTTMPSTMPSGN